MLSSCNYQHSSVVTSVVFVCTTAIHYHLVNSVLIWVGLIPDSWFQGRHMFQAWPVKLRPEILRKLLGKRTFFKWG